VIDGGFLTALAGGRKPVPDRVAIVDDAQKQTLTYGDLRTRVAGLAAALRARGLERGDRVALVLESSWQYVVCCLGTLDAGGIVVPLNPAARARDLGAWITHADARFVIAESANPSLAAVGAALPQGSRLLVCGGEDDPLAGSPAAAEVVCPKAEADAPAMILFTSGTTGAPKGVLLSHGNLHANAEGIIESLGLDASDSILTALPFFYAYGNSVLLSHLGCGARVIVERGFTFPHAIVEAMVRERASGFAGVPSTFALLLSRVVLSNYDLSALRYVTQAGGAMAPPLTRRLMAALPGKQIFVMYGQTEAAARLTCLPAGRLEEKLGSAGLPLSGVRLEIRDAAGAALPANSVGEIWATGPNIMRGYWRNPEATSAVLHDGWLKTGDVGRLDDEGFLYIVGRRSDIIKVGAHRVHPQDVEDVLAELDDVAESAVIGVDDDILGEVIKAFVLLRPGSGLKEQQVKRHCLEKLAPYKVPRFVEFVNSLPRTASGKIQRAALQTAGESK
jgi:acyl-CoA synthetase (AMP-forming)/AMP-acid ligase II